jgi:hypothetical protein
MAICVLPLKVGLLNILHKSQQQACTTSDLFIAYQGANFGKYILYFIAFTSISTIFATIPFLGLIANMFLIIYTLLVSPIILFEDKSISQALAQSKQMIGRYFGISFVLLIITSLASLSGLFLFIVGLVVTWPFSIIMCYCLYTQIKDITQKA